MDGPALATARFCETRRFDAEKFEMVAVNKKLATRAGRSRAAR